MIGGFQVGPYQTNFQQEGIGLADEEGIGLAPIAKPVDIVIQSPHWMPFSVRPFGTVKSVVTVQKQERSELQEMMQMYSKWRATA